MCCQCFLCCLQNSKTKNRTYYWRIVNTNSNEESCEHNDGEKESLKFN